MQASVQQCWPLRAPQLCKRLAIAAYVWQYWREPVVLLQRNLLWPMSSWFTMPAHSAASSAGAISGALWAVLCQAASSLVSAALANDVPHRLSTLGVGTAVL